MEATALQTSLSQLLMELLDDPPCLNRTAGEVIADLRRRVEAARSSLLRSLGEGYLAHGNPEAATGALERALEHTPDDESVARTLVAACLQSGRLARAEQLRKEFSLV